MRSWRVRTSRVHRRQRYFGLSIPSKPTLAGYEMRRIHVHTSLSVIRLVHRMDVLSDVLAVTRMGATVIAQAELVPHWGLEVDPVAEAHVHVVQRGVCWLRTSSERRWIQLAAGDVVLIRGGVGHAICSSPKTRPAPYRAVLDAMPRRLAALPASRAHETTVVLCAKYLFQHVGPHPLTTLLPPLVHLPAHRAEQRLRIAHRREPEHLAFVPQRREAEKLRDRLVEEAGRVAGTSSPSPGRGSSGSAAGRRRRRSVRRARRGARSADRPDPRRGS